MLQAQLAICVIGLGKDTIHDLNTSNSKNVEPKVDSEGHSNFEGATLKLVSTSQEAQKILHQAGTVTK